MTYSVSLALQAAVYHHLSADIDLGNLVGAAIYDQVPAGTVPALYVSLGAEVVRDRSDKTGAGAAHDLTISVVSDGAGFLAAKQAAGAVSDALIDAPLNLSRGRLISLNFLRARARRVGNDDLRRIDLTFRARIED